MSIVLKTCMGMFAVQTRITIPPQFRSAPEKEGSQPAEPVAAPIAPSDSQAGKDPSHPR